MKVVTWIIVRHAEAADGTPDIDRELTERGQRQHDLFMAGLELERFPPVTFIASSPATRAIQTVAPNYDCTRLSELYTVPEDTDDHRLLTSLFVAHQNSRVLCDYVGNDTGAFKRWADAAFAAVLAAMEVANVTKGTVLIGTHALIANALALAIVGDRNINSRELILKHALGNGDALIVKPNGKVSIM